MKEDCAKWIGLPYQVVTEWNLEFVNLGKVEVDLKSGGARRWQGHLAGIELNYISANYNFGLKLSQITSLLIIMLRSKQFNISLQSAFPHLLLNARECWKLADTACVICKVAPYQQVGHLSHCPSQHHKSHECNEFKHMFKQTYTFHINLATLRPLSLSLSPSQQ